MIIDKPELKTISRKLGEGSITFILWVLWSYFILPVINLFLWLLGVRLFYREVLSKQAYLYFLEVLQKGGFIIFITTLVIMGWIYYNYLLFKKRGERRKHVKIVNDEEIAAFYNVDLNTLNKFKNQSLVKAIINERSEIQFL
ncbi:MAG: hypothetical protein AMJ45_05830 [Syntrophobacter sp. DG_60]|nr:MAG: hypothetical protein AMJ45_05830 [Syntrophobacter sp. DG_60]